MKIRLFLTALLIACAGVNSIALGVPTEAVRIKSLADEKIAAVTLLGSEAKLDWKQEADALVVQPVAQWPTKFAVAFKITLKQ